ncbi:MAG: hypothetical protein Q9194_001856 [Teloschistes cf. exilis]
MYEKSPGHSQSSVYSSIDEGATSDSTRRLSVTVPFDNPDEVQEIQVDPSKRTARLKFPLSDHRHPGRKADSVIAPNFEQATYERINTQESRYRGLKVGAQDIRTQRYRFGRVRRLRMVYSQALAVRSPNTQRMSPELQQYTVTIPFRSQMKDGAMPERQLTKNTSDCLTQSQSLKADVFSLLGWEKKELS